MLWRLPPSVRSLLVSNCCRHSSTKSADPLKVLFCGADEFSIKSLRALSDAKQADPKLIKSIEVVHRPGKPTGRGLKVIREVPIKRVATEELNLITHEIDTFTGWAPPSPFDIIIAVSFGLFVPPRILNAAQYGGLNVHPSLLPDLRGPAPIYHTLLKRRETTGVTVQTLHPKHFDHGKILAQTPAPGITIPWPSTPGDLVERLGTLGGEMLVDVLKNRAFVPPLEDVSWYGDSGGPVDHAEKITPWHRNVDFSTATAEQIIIHKRVLGDLWCTLPGGQRLILHDLVLLNEVDSRKREPGIFISDGTEKVVACTFDGGLLEIQSSTVASGKKGTGNAHAVRLLKHHNKT